jgi:hypothetical protein
MVVAQIFSFSCFEQVYKLVKFKALVIIPITLLWIRNCQFWIQIPFTKKFWIRTDFSKFSWSDPNSSLIFHINDCKEFLLASKKRLHKTISLLAYNSQNYQIALYFMTCKLNFESASGPDKSIGSLRIWMHNTAYKEQKNYTSTYRHEIFFCVLLMILLL